MNTPEVMLEIARINKCSKSIEAAYDNEIMVNFEELKCDLKIIASDSSALKVYLNSHITDRIAERIEDLTNASAIIAYIKRISKGIQVKSVKLQIDLLSKLADTISYMKKIASTYRTLSKKSEYKGLKEDFQTPEGLEAFRTAVKKGFLKADYSPNNLTLLQQRYLATALGQYSHLLVGHQISAFKLQWGNKDFSQAKPFMRKDDVIEQIKNTYPDTDFTIISKIHTEDHFDVINSEEEILTLFMALITYRYVDPRTKYEDFLKIFGIGNMDERTLVNWIGKKKELVAFIYLAFDSINRRIWGRACKCFVTNGKPLNRKTLSPLYNRIKNRETCFPYFKKIKTICDEFNKNVIL